MNEKAARAHLEKIVSEWLVTPQTSFEIAVITKANDEKIGRTEICLDRENNTAMIRWCAWIA